MILFVQTFGDFVNFNPHVPVLAADGAFLPDGRFLTLAAVPGSLLAEGFRGAVLKFLVNNDALSPDRYEHLVRCVGWYSNRARGERAKEASPHASLPLTCHPTSPERRAAGPALDLARPGTA